MMGPDGADREAAELLDGEPEPPPEGDREPFEDLDLNDCNDWEFVP